MNVTNEFEINLTCAPDERTIPEIHAYQREALSRKIEFTLKDGDNDWTIPSNAVCLIRFVKPDGHGGVYSTLPDTSNAWLVEGNKLSVTLVPQMFDIAGYVEGEAALLWADKSLTVTDFHIIVARNPNITEEVTSDYYNYQNLDEINTALARMSAKTITDSTLSLEGHSADASAVGVAISQLSSKIEGICPEQIGAAIGSKSLPSGTDLNTITASGMYRLEANNVNAPSGVAWGQLLVIHGGFDTITQIIGDYGSGRLYTRSGDPSDVGGIGTWSEWGALYDSCHKPSLAELGAAPAGFGLGSNTKLVSDFNDAHACGWYVGISGTANSPDINSFILVEAFMYNDDWLVQRAYALNGGYPEYRTQYIRYKQSTVWTDWDCINPPMVLGVEYRTTKRYKGHPVYTKAISCGAPVNGDKSVVWLTEDESYGQTVHLVSVTATGYQASGVWVALPQIGVDSDGKASVLTVHGNSWGLTVRCNWDDTSTITDVVAVIEFIRT